MPRGRTTLILVGVATLILLVTFMYSCRQGSTDHEFDERQSQALSLTQDFSLTDHLQTPA